VNTTLNSLWTCLVALCLLLDVIMVMDEYLVRKGSRRIFIFWEMLSHHNCLYFTIIWGRTF